MRYYQPRQFLLCAMIPVLSIDCGVYQRHDPMYSYYCNSLVPCNHGKLNVDIYRKPTHTMDILILTHTMTENIRSALLLHFCLGL